MSTELGNVLKHLDDTLVITITRRRRRVVRGQEYHKLSEGGEQGVTYGYVEADLIEDVEIPVLKQELPVGGEEELRDLTRRTIAVLNALTLPPA